MMTISADRQQAILQASEEFYQIILNKLKNEKGVHAETAIAAAARMAGTFLLRSFNFPIDGMEPGSAVLSDAANEKGPFLINLLGTVLSQMGVQIDVELLGEAPGRGAPPHLTVNETQVLVEAALIEISDNYRLSLEEAAHAAAITTAHFIRQCAGILEPNVAFNIAAYGFVEGSKTVPAPLAPKASRKPWYKAW